MKKLQFLFFFLFIGLSTGLNAQSMESDPAEPTVTAEACFENIIRVDYDMTNTSGGDLNFLWRVDRIDVPEEWELQVCDLVTCYIFGLEAAPVDRPNTLLAGVTTSQMNFKVITNNVPGIGDFDLVFFNETDENDVFINLPIVVNATACTSATHDPAVVDALSIYPNPAGDFFKVSNPELVERLSVYNIVGKEVKTMEKSNSGSYDIADLTYGMYLVRMFDEDGDIIKVSRLSKR